jgi:hypothetical protein
MSGFKRILFFTSPQIYVYLGLSLGLYAIGYVVLHMNFLWSILFSMLPVAFFMFLHLLKKPYLALMLLFILNYLVFGLARYILPGLKPGILMDGVIAVVFGGLVAYSFNEKLHWDNLKNGLTIVVTIWFLFCILNILNPMAPVEAWVIGIRRNALYLFVFPVLTFLLFHRYKDLKIILFLWSICVLAAVLKALAQKYIGFDAGDMRFLYVEGKARTHILYSGIRYFSFFSDAANFGCAMAFAMVCFSISALYIKNKMLKIYFVIVSILAAYGMLISGTRAAIAVPFAGYALFALLSKKTKVIIAGAILLAGAFAFLNFTSIGDGNSYIRRMRTAFHPEKDPSFVLRMENQKKMRAYLADKPFGVGIGTSKAIEYSNSEVSKIPTDSWLVMIWVETGIVGLTLYLGIIIFILTKGGYIVMFKVKNNELRGIECALLAGIFGMFVASYANEVVAQFPNGPIIYMAMAFVFMAERFDQEIQNKIPEDGKAT